VAGSTVALAGTSSWTRGGRGGGAVGETPIAWATGSRAAVHGLRPEESTAILGLFESWGEVDRSHRKLAHRGSYLEIVWVSAATVRRVLAAHGLVLKRPRRVRSERRPFPEWADYRRNSI
jgi:putative transposase